MATKKKTTKKATKKAKTSRSKKASNASGSRLLIVESPAKARTIGRYLDDRFVVCHMEGK